MRFTGPSALAAVPLGGCGCGGGGGGSTARQPSSGAATIGVTRSGVGDALVDSHNRSVHLFEKDPRQKSACVGACGGAWPVVSPAVNRITGHSTSGRSNGY